MKVCWSIVIDMRISHTFRIRISRQKRIKILSMSNYAKKKWGISLPVCSAKFELNRLQAYTTDACYEKRGFGSTRRQMNSNSPVLFRSSSIDRR